MVDEDNGGHIMNIKKNSKNTRLRKSKKYLYKQTKSNL